jgi:hypothetical protein
MRSNSHSCVVALMFCQKYEKPAAERCPEGSAGFLPNTQALPICPLSLKAMNHAPK